AVLPGCNSSFNVVGMHCGDPVLAKAVVKNAGDIIPPLADIMNDAVRSGRPRDQLAKVDCVAISRVGCSERSDRGLTHVDIFQRAVPALYPLAFPPSH